jgi:hypothetical protein
MMAKWVITVAGDAGMAALFYFGIVQGVPGARNLYLFIEWSLALFIFAMYRALPWSKDKESEGV